MKEHLPDRPFGPRPPKHRIRDAIAAFPELVAERNENVIDLESGQYVASPGEWIELLRSADFGRDTAEWAVWLLIRRHRLVLWGEGDGDGLYMTTRRLRKPIYLNVGKPSDKPPAVQVALPVPEAETRPKRKGRGAKGEPPKAMFVLHALKVHHKRQTDGSIGNPDPIQGKDLAKLAGVSAGTVSRFFRQRFSDDDGQQMYEAACRGKRIGRLLGEWLAEVPGQFGELFDGDRPEEPDWTADECREWAEEYARNRHSEE